MPGRTSSVTRRISQILEPLPGRRLCAFMNAAQHYSTARGLHGQTLALGRVRQLLMSQIRDALQKDFLLRTGAARYFGTLTPGKSSDVTC